MESSFQCSKKIITDEVLLFRFRMKIAKHTCYTNINIYVKAYFEKKNTIYYDFTVHSVAYVCSGAKMAQYFLARVDNTDSWSAHVSVACRQFAHSIGVSR